MGLGVAFRSFFRCLSDRGFAAQVAGLLSGAPPPPPAAEPPPPPPPFPPGAVSLLALLQREGRLVDFLQEEIEGFSDEEVGAVSRGLHAGCRRALQEYLTLAPAVPQREGDRLVVEPGFDPSRLRLVGRVEGDPPFQGTLRHHGWQLTAARLPEAPAGSDPSIVLPAEVEIG